MLISYRQEQVKIQLLFYIVKQKKGEICLNKENLKITKRAHAFKGYASSYNVEISNYFNLELNVKIVNLQLKLNKTKLLSELRGF